MSRRVWIVTVCAAAAVWACGGSPAPSGAGSSTLIGATCGAAGPTVCAPDGGVPDGGVPDGGVPDGGVAVVVSPSTIDAVSMAGLSYQFSATVTGTSNASVVWSIEEQSYANGTVDASGRYTPPQQQSATFVCHIVATSQADPSKSARATVNVWGDLVDHGGRVDAAPRVFLVWWGPSSSFAADDRSVAEGFLSGITGSRFLGLLGQYLHGATPQVTMGGSYVIDTTATPTTPSTVDAITSQACSTVTSHGATLQDNDILTVATTTPPQDFVCGWHSWTQCQGRNVLLAYLPSHSGFCNTYEPTCGTSNTVEALSLTQTLAHELFEIMTDPWGDGWFASGEIADRCGAPTCLSLGPGTYVLPSMYSNAVHGCAVQ